MNRSGAAAGSGARPASYGLVVLSVNVSVLLYVPVRSGSLAPMACLKPIGTTSLDTGAAYVFSVSGEALIAANALVPPWAWSGCGERERPVDQVARVGRAVSTTLSVASPAVEMTVASVAPTYSLATPGVNAPSVAGAPSVSDSVAGTVPPTVPPSQLP